VRHEAAPVSLDGLLARTVLAPETGCLLWTGPVDASGYGRVHHNGRTVRVARLVMAWSYGYEIEDVPSRVLTRHLCHQRLCVNADHLRAGSAWANVHDCIAAGRLPQAWVGDRCPRGHDLTVPGAIRRNGTSPAGRPKRTCDLCRRERDRRRWADRGGR